MYPPDIREVIQYYNELFIDHIYNKKNQMFNPIQLEDIVPFSFYGWYNANRSTIFYTTKECDCLFFYSDNLLKEKGKKFEIPPITNKDWKHYSKAGAFYEIRKK